MGKGLLGLMHANARIRNNFQSWLDQGGVQSMGTDFKETMVNKVEVDKKGKIDKFQPQHRFVIKDFLICIILGLLTNCCNEVNFPLKHSWGDNMYISLLVFLGTQKVLY